MTTYYLLKETKVFISSKLEDDHEILGKVEADNYIDAKKELGIELSAAQESIIASRKQ